MRTYKDFREEVLAIIPGHYKQELGEELEERIRLLTIEGIDYIASETTMRSLLTPEAAGRKVAQHIIDDVYLLEHKRIENDNDKMQMETYAFHALKNYVAANMNPIEEKKLFGKMWSWIGKYRASVISSPDFAKGVARGTRQFP